MSKSSKKEPQIPSKKKFHLRNVYIVILVFLVAALFSLNENNNEITNHVTVTNGTIHDFNENWERVYLDATSQTISLPYYRANDEKLIVLKNTIPKEYAGLTLSFFSAGEAMNVYIDDELVYQYGISGDPDFSHSPDERQMPDLASRSPLAPASSGALRSPNSRSIPSSASGIPQATSGSASGIPQTTSGSASGIPQTTSGSASGIPQTASGSASGIPQTPSGDPDAFSGASMNISEENIIYQNNSKTMQGITNFISIPDTLSEGTIMIQMVLSDSVNHHRMQIGTMRIAERDTTVIQILKDNLFALFCCFLDIICAIVLLILAVIRRISKQPRDGIFALSLLCFTSALYFMTRNQIAMVFSNSQSLYQALEYLSLMLLPLFFLMYYEEHLSKIFHFSCRLLIGLTCFNFLGQLAVSYFGFFSLEECSFLSRGILLISNLWMAYGLFLFKKRHHAKILLEIPAILLFVAGTSCELIFLDVLQFDSDYGVSQYTTTVSILFLTLLHARNVAVGYSGEVAKNAALMKEQMDYMVKQNQLLTQANEKAEEAKLEAIAASEAKGRFLANMSHEIRTPINAVLGMDAMILRETTEESIKEYAMDIQTAGQTLLSLINDILDFSKIESGKMTIVPVDYDFSSMIHDIINMISVKAKAKQLKLNISIDETMPSRLYGDDVRIRQILTNILTNAVKYTERGSVTLTIQGKGREGDMVHLWFSVKDTGIGIKEEDISKLFVEFERIEEKRNRTIEGTGLGMNITIQLLALMNSKLNVESTYGEGSTFSFLLDQKIMKEEPIGNLEKRIHQQAEDFSYKAALTAPNARLLVVDDNLMNRRVFKNLLKQTKIRIDEAASGVECIDLAAQHSYDIIFLDHMMPEMDGIETLHQMKEMAEYPSKNAKVIALTANAITGAREMYLSEGFDNFLSKPVNPDKLEAMIRELLPKELIEQPSSHQPDGTASTKPPASSPEVPELSEEEKKPPAAPSSADDFPQIDGMDFGYGLMHLPDAELLLQTISDFYTTLESEAKKLEKDFTTITDSIDQEQQKEALNAFRIKVHAMKSSSALIGAIPLSGPAKILEYAAKDGKIEVISALTPIFLHEWMSYKDKLSILFPSATEEKSAMEDVSTLTTYLQLIGNAMEEFDVDTADAAMQQIEQYEYPAPISSLLDELKAAIINLEDETAGELIHKIQEQLP